MAKLKAYVHVDGRMYGPDDDVPAKVAALITNPDAWESEPEEKPAPRQSAPRKQAPRKRAAKKPAGAESAESGGSGESPDSPDVGEAGGSDSSGS